MEGMEQIMNGIIDEVGNMIATQTKEKQAYIYGLVKAFCDDCKPQTDLWNFERNETMKILGNQTIGAMLADGSEESKVIKEIMDGTQVPETTQNIILVSYGVQMGKILGIREERRKKKLLPNK